MITHSEKIGYLLNQILYSAFSFGIVFFAARILQIDSFGRLSYALSLIPLLSIAPLSFIYFPFMNFYSTWEDQKRDYFAASFLLNFIIILILTVAFGVTLYLTNIESGELTSLLLYFVLFQIFEFYRRTLITRAKIKVLNYIEAIRITLLVGGLIALYHFKEVSIKNYITILNAIILTSIIMSLMYGGHQKLTFSKLLLRKVYRQSYKFGKFIFLSNIVQNLSANLFIYLSVVLLTAESIARLNAPKILLGVTSIFLLGMDNYYTPKIARRKAGGELVFSKELKRIFKDLRSFYFVLFSACILMIFFQDSIVKGLFGIEYAVGDNYLWGFILVGLIYSVTRPFLILIRVFERTKFLFVSSVWVLIFALVITYPLMSMYGATGGLLVMILASILQLFIFIFDLQRNAAKIS